MPYLPYSEYRQCPPKAMCSRLALRVGPLEGTVDLEEVWWGGPEVTRASVKGAVGFLACDVSGSL